jgi:hypothetical protein
VSLDSRAFLTCHPSTPCAAIRRFAVRVWRGGNTLALAYRLEGDIAALDIPPAGPPLRADGLWQNTCCEAFAKGAGQEYVEFNFSPSTAWASYRFTAYRQGMALVDMIEPVKIAVCRTARRFELEAIVNLGNPPMLAQGTLRLGLSAVIKQTGGGVSHWAFAHPKAKPDFHHTDSFAFELGPYRP